MVSTNLQELEKVFLDETLEMVQMFDDAVLALEKDPTNVDAIQSAFRAVHTIKGGSASMGYVTLEKISHSVEDLLDMIRSKEISVSKEIVDLLFRVSDILNKIVTSILDNKKFEDEKILDEIILAISGYIKKGEGKHVKSVENTKSSGKLEYKGDVDLRNIIKNFITSGRKVYVLKVYFDENSPLKEVGILQVVSILKDACEMIDSEPSLEEIYQRFFSEVLFIVSTDDIVRLSNRIKISDIVKDVEYSEYSEEITQREKLPDVKPGALEEVRPKESVIRIENSKIDILMNMVGELIVNRSNLNENVFYLGEYLSRFMEDFNTNLKLLRSTLSELFFTLKGMDIETESIMPIIENSNESLEKLISIHSVLVELKKRYDALVFATRNLNSISVDIQERVTTLRMIPIEYIFSRFPRIVRDLSSNLGKKVKLITKGGETNLDKSVVDDLFDPLVHLIRNCIDHGIESPEERLKLGKPEYGVIYVEAINEGSSIVIRVKDDGRGIDLEKVRKRAIEKNLIQPGVSYSKEQLLSLIFVPGFSTKEEVSNISGRGVGMDIVKERIEKLKGTISIGTSLGKGTLVSIRLPMTVAIMKVLLFEVKGVVLAVSVNSIEEALIISKNDISKFEAKRVIKLRDEIINIFCLRELYFNEPIEDEELNVIVISTLGKKYAFIVDKFLGEEDIFIKPLDLSLISPPGVVSSTVLGNGRIGFVLDMSNLVSFIEKLSPQQGEVYEQNI